MNESLYCGQLIEHCCGILFYGIISTGTCNVLVMLCGVVVGHI